MLIREYNYKDIVSLQNILDKDLGYCVEINELQSRISEMMKRRNYRIYVACEEDKIVGFVGFVTFLAFEIKNECIKITALAVSEEYRRQGIGTLLLNVVEKFASDNSIDVVSLNSGLSREDAHLFYEKHGFSKKSYGFIKHI